MLLNLRWLLNPRRSVLLLVFVTGTPTEAPTDFLEPMGDKVTFDLKYSREHVESERLAK